MAKLIIEGLRANYCAIARAITKTNTSKRAEAFGALEEICRILLCSTTYYKGMSTQELMMHIGQDIRYVSGDMTNEEMERHRRYHHELSVQNENGLHDWEKYDKPAY